MDLHELNVRINVAGISTSAMHEAAVALDQSDPRAAALVRSIERHGQDLASIQQWSSAAKDGDKRPDAGLPPGYEVIDVGDVGDRQGHGAIKASDLSPANWAYYQQHNLGPKWSAIFSDTIDAVNAAIGVVAGNLTQYGDGEPKVGNWTLAAFG